ncbi:MAG: hypothetical protein NXI27_24715 [Alphaproteobacteria bacterium]|nr:hypothetical protein [Alphaproteobacteria bacterium]
MLRLLVDFLSGIIRVLAAVFIVGGAFAGYVQAPALDVEPWAGALIGFAAGFLAASLGAGLFACFILIENHLRVLADAHVLSGKSAPTSTPLSSHEEEKAPDETALERAERVAAYTEKYRSQSVEQPNDNSSSASKSSADEGSGKSARAEK